MESKLPTFWPLPLRALLGVAFVIHGSPKILSLAGHEAFSDMLASMSVPLAGATAWLVGFLEFFGGLALLVGLFTAEISVLLGVEMLVAMFLVHLPHGFMAVNVTEMTPAGPHFGMPGIEVNLLYLAALLALFIGGPGPLSFDERVLSPQNRSKPPWLRHGAAHA
ncbi:MAG TPA: DoxX family protein [Anaeromyxobacteraceae bacterium]|nr:DoxX family protein [Anaeromyxobacteraceae bacterium]